MLEDLGARIAGERSLPDHGDYDQTLLDVFSREAREAGANAIIATDKDAVKIEGLTAAGPPIKILRIAADFGACAKDLRKLLLNC